MKTAAPNDKGQEEFVGIDIGIARQTNLEAVPRIKLLSAYQDRRVGETTADGVV